MPGGTSTRYHSIYQIHAHSKGFCAHPAEFILDSIQRDVCFVIDLVGFGRQLQGIRIERGLTQEQLAEQSGLSAHYIGNLEQGVRKPSATALLTLCHALGTTPDRLLQDSISEEMRKGLSVDIGHATTLREALHVFEDILSDYFVADEKEPECFGIPQSRIPAPEDEAREDTLSALLLRVPKQNDNP